MMFSLFKQAAIEIRALSLIEKRFILLAMACGFLISGEYAIIRPASSSIFLQTYGSDFLPYSWLMSIPLNIGALWLYNRFLPKIGCFKIFSVLASFVALVHLGLYFSIHKYPSLSFFHYAWKEVYIMLMLQLLWSVIHTTISCNRASYLYGLLFANGALGGFTGSFIASKLALEVGTEALYLFTMPAYAALAFAYFHLLKNSRIAESQAHVVSEKKEGLSSAFALILRSKLLRAIACMVIFMQMCSTLTDFQFNTFLEQRYPDLHVRTSYLAALLSVGNVITMTLQIFGVYILISLAGKYRSHMGVPVVLALNAVVFFLYPQFGTMAYSYLAIKAFDFSFFNVIKETLYIPLKNEEKFKAKPLIDVFLHRASKVFASIFVIFLQYLFTKNLVMGITWINFVVFILWCYVVYSIKQYYDLERQQLPAT